MVWITTPNASSGIISALAFSAAGSYTDAYYAAGSLTSTPHNIVLFAETQGGNPIMYVGNSGGKAYGGVTQVLSPSRCTVYPNFYPPLLAPVSPNQFTYSICLVPRKDISWANLRMGSAQHRCRHLKSSLSHIPNVPRYR